MTRLFEKHEIIPVGNYVILRRADIKEKSAGGLFLPTRAQEKSLQAEVLAVGPGMYLSGGGFAETSVAPGDTVIIDKIGGIEIELEGEKLLIVREPEIFAVIKEK